MLGTEGFCEAAPLVTLVRIGPRLTAEACHKRVNGAPMAVGSLFSGHGIVEINLSMLASDNHAT